MATTNVKTDVHSLSVVWNRTYEQTATGRESVKEQWLKVAILGAEGSVAAKFALLCTSALQFKVSTAQRVQDAKASDTYYPRGSECAQLFTVLAGMPETVDMTGFDADKWAKRFPVSSHAHKQLSKLIPAPVATGETSQLPNGKKPRKAQSAV